MSFTDVHNVYICIEKTWLGFYKYQRSIVREMESSRFYLPQGLLEEILSRLPVKSLIRFKSVKKSWSNLLQNRRFIEKQYYYRLPLFSNASKSSRWELGLYYLGITYQPKIFLIIALSSQWWWRKDDHGCHDHPLTPHVCLHPWHNLSCWFFRWLQWLCVMESSN